MTCCLEVIAIIKAVREVCGSECRVHVRLNCCNRSQKVVVVGQVANPAEAIAIQRIVDGSRANLREVVRRLHMDDTASARGGEIRNYNVRKLDRPRDAANHQEVVLGIVQAADDFLKFLQPPGTKFNEDEGWARLHWAGCLSRVHLQEKLTEDEALTHLEWEQLNRKTTAIRQFGSFAVAIWQLSVMYENDYAAMNTIGILSPAQTNLLTKYLKKHPDFTQARTFQELHNGAKECFLETARLLPIEVIEKYQMLEKSLITPDAIDDSLMIEAESYTGSSLIINELCQKIGRISNRDSAHSQRIQSALGFVRAKAILVRLDLNPEHLERASEEELLRLNQEWMRFKRFDGAIVHLFHAFKDTINKIQLNEQYNISEQKFDAFVQQVKANPFFLYELTKACEVGALSCRGIALLSKVAELYTEDELVQFEADHSLGEWVAETRERSVSPERTSSDDEKSGEA